MEPDQPADAVHQMGLERALGRIFAVFMALIVVEFWSSTATLAGQRPGSVAANPVRPAIADTVLNAAFQISFCHRSYWMSGEIRMG